MPREVAESSRILPVLARDDRLFVAMANPRDKSVIDELEFVTGRRSIRTSRSRARCERTIRGAYDAKDAGRALLRRTAGAPRRARATRSRERQRARRRPHAGGRRRLATSSATASRPAHRPSSSTSRSQEAADEAVIEPSDLEPLDEDVSQVEMLSPEMRSAAGMGGPAPASGSGKKILVVDDEEDIRKLVRRLLDGQGLSRHRGRSRARRAPHREGGVARSHPPRRDAPRAPRLRHRAAASRAATSTARSRS